MTWRMLGASLVLIKIIAPLPRKPSLSPASLTFLDTPRPAGRLYCEQFAGLFLSDRAEELATHCEAIPNSIVLEDDNGDLFLVVSSAALPLRSAWRPGAFPFGSEAPSAV